MLSNSKAKYKSTIKYLHKISQGIYKRNLTKSWVESHSITGTTWLFW